MPASLSGAADRPPRRARHLVPLGLPRRRELLAALATGAVLGQLALAPLTLLLAVLLWTAARISRWRASWLAVPAGLGAAWTLTAGPAREAAAATVLPGQLAGLLTRLAAGHPPVPHAALAAAGHALPRQLPLALVTGSAEACWLLWLDWLHQAGGETSRRPGLVALVRRRYLTAAIRGGSVVTRDGCCVGVDELTGRRASVSWREAEGGVLCGGPDLAEAAGHALGLLDGAIRRRKGVVIIDMAGGGMAGTRRTGGGLSTWPGATGLAETGLASTELAGAGLAGTVARACAAAHAPLACYGGLAARDAAGCYEPFRGRTLDEVTGLVLALPDWSGRGAAERASAARHLRTALAVLADGPGDPRLPLLDQLIPLLQAALLRERAAPPPGGTLPSGAPASPTGLSLLVSELSGLRGSALGQWLRPARLAVSHRVPRSPARGGAWRPAGEHALGISQTLLERGVALFALDQRVHRRSAGMIARLAAADFLAALTEFDRLSARSDCLLWVSGCEVLGQQLAESLIRRGTQAGAAVVLSTAQPAVLSGLAQQARVLIASGPARTALGEADPSHGRVAPGDERALAAAMPGMAAFGPLNSSRRDGIRTRGAQPEPAALLVRSPGSRLLPRCRLVSPGGWR